MFRVFKHRFTTKRCEVSPFESTLRNPAQIPRDLLPRPLPLIRPLIQKPLLARDQLPHIRHSTLPHIRRPRPAKAPAPNPVDIALPLEYHWLNSGGCVATHSGPSAPSSLPTVSHQSRSMRSWLAVNSSSPNRCRSLSLGTAVRRRTLGFPWYRVPCGRPSCGAGTPGQSRRARWRRGGARGVPAMLQRHQA